MIEVVVAKKGHRVRIVFEKYSASLYFQPPPPLISEKLISFLDNELEKVSAFEISEGNLCVFDKTLLARGVVDLRYNPEIKKGSDEATERAFHATAKRIAQTIANRLAGDD